MSRLEPVTADFAAGTPGAVPAYASNTMRTLRVVRLLAARRVRPHPYDGDPLPLRHADAVGEAVAATLSVAAPYAG